MLKPSQEIFLAKILASGTAFTTIFLVSGSVTDPVNATKLLPLGITATVALGTLISSGNRLKIQRPGLLISLLTLFVTLSFASVLFSKSPISQNLYGVYGRNNGFFTYLALSIILYSTSKLRLVGSFSKLQNALLVAGIVNAVYSLWAIAFGDFIGWNNPYGNILGTFGNPNFIGSFLGIFLGFSLSMALNLGLPLWKRVLASALLPLISFEIYKSHAIQGRIVGIAGIAIVLFYFVRSRYGRKITIIYLCASLASGVLALLGTLQIGPLTQFLYKTSVSLRGQYWLAGWNTGQSHPFFGVGMDAFGDWYRRSRDAHALELPGVNTIVNASHNVPLDIFAFGGWPLFLSYLSLMGLGGFALLRVTLRSVKFDPVLAFLTSAWFGYQLQSIISINQIGLAIWGWVLTGAAIAYEKMTRESNSEKITVRQKPINKITNKDFEVKAPTLGILFAIAGLIIFIPPLTADAQWRKAQISRTIEPIKSTMIGTYFNPQNSYKYLTNIQILEENQLFDLSHKYALEAVKWNPEAFELWKVLYLIKNSSESEKALALQNMKRLDPLNPDVTSIK